MSCPSFRLIQPMPGKKLPVLWVVAASSVIRQQAITALTELSRLSTRRRRIPATGAVIRYELAFPDGTVHKFSKLDGSTTKPRRVFLTQIIDPQGKTLTLNYDAQLRLTRIVDAIGKHTILSYTNSNPLLVTKITDPFGRFALLDYDGSGRLASITDVLGITSSFTYDTTDPSFIKSLTTPYDTSNFVYGEDSNSESPWLELTNPLNKTERVEFKNGAPGIGDTPPIIPSGISVSEGTFSRFNSFHWDSYVNSTFGHSDYTKAHLTHWLTNSEVQVTSAVSAVKPSLENYTFFNYPEQPYPNQEGTLDRPSAIGRVLDDGTTQLVQASYNKLGKPLNITDPLGRVSGFGYAANNIDLTTQQQKTSASGYSTVGAFDGYNSQHLPQTYTDAAGKLWSFAYNKAGQLIYATNPLNQAQFWEYDKQARLVKTTIPQTVAFADVVYGTTNAGLAAAETRNYTTPCAGITPPANTNLPISITDSGLLEQCYQYDALDRVTKIKYPGGTADEFSYNFPNSWPVVAARGKPSLDLWKVTDRLGRVTSYSYDQNRRRTAVTEPVTVDGVTTTRTTRYQYYANGALKNLIDANGNITHWEIDIQSRPTSKTYAYGTADAKTELYSYDLAGRLKTITDAKGQVLTNTYNKDDTLARYAYTKAATATPGASFTYDLYFPRLTKMTDQFGTTNWTYKPIGTNGALQLASENPPFANDTVNYGYDAIGRMSSRTVPGAAAETFGYDVIGRLKTHNTALGAITYGYLGNTRQPTSRRLINGTVTLKSNWGYDSNVNNRRLTSIIHSGKSRSYTLDYLIPGAAAHNLYDIMQITETASVISQSSTFSYDNSDRLLSASSATLGNYNYYYDELDNIIGYYENGKAVAPNYNGLNQLKQFQLDQNFDYDANGNTTREYNGSNVTLRDYNYDAADRIIKVTNAGNVSEYKYDGLGRRVKSLSTSGSITTENRYLWCGSRLCQQRDGLDAVQTRFYHEGEVRNGQKLLYNTDHLGSVRDVVDTTTAAKVGSLDYAPYGAVTQSSGIQPSFQYAGLLWDNNAGLSLSNTRFYDAGIGRWLIATLFERRVESIFMGMFEPIHWAIMTQGGFVAPLHQSVS